MSRSRLRTILSATLLVLLFAAVLFAVRGRGEMRDFEVYWTAGARAARAAPLYREQDGHYRFKYLPGFAVAVSPLSALPLDAAKAAWLALSIFAIGVLVRVSVESARPSSLSRRAVAALTVIAMAKFLAHELVLGQANLLFAATCSTALGALLRSRDAAAGALFGAAVLIKPYAVGFVPYLLLTRRWRAAAAAALATAAALALPLLQYGPEATLALMREWWHTVTETSVPLLTNADAISVYAMFAKWLGWGRTAAALSLVVVAALGAACAGVLACRGHITRPEVLEIGILLTLIPLVTPQGWDYVLLLSTPLIALLISRTPQLSPIDRVVWVAAIVVVAFSLFDVLGRAAYGRFMALSTITVCYLAIIAIAVRLRLRGVA